MKFSNSPVLSQPLPIWRSRLLQLVLLACFVALIGRSLYLQGIHNDFLREKGEARYERVLEISATRGRIMDRHGEMLSMSTPVKSIWAIPDDARLQPAQVRNLARLLEMDVRELTRKLASDRDFVFIKRQIPPEVADRIVQMKLSGIHQQQEYRRYYPGGEVTAHMLGFTGVDDSGQEGVELAMNASLSGKAGSRRVIKDRRGEIVEDVESIKPPQDGRDIVLALDDKIQYLAYTNLRQAIAEFKAKAGGIVVIDARTGEVLALANLPTYNPNNRQGLVGAQLRNRALTDSFEPGSTMKPFTAALALEQGKFRYDTLINTAPGRMTVGNATIHDAHMHGMLTVAQVIQKSSNVGAAKMALSLPPQSMWRMFDGLGFGSPLKLGFPGEVGGRLRPWNKWQPIEQATMAYGHGISVTLMQLAHAYLVFARDGDLIPLSLTKADGPVPVGKQIFTAQTAHEVRNMLEMVVGEGGTAPKAFVPGYRAGGKTGTAHKIEGGAYANKYVASFVGLAPASDPRLVIAVMVDEPSTGIYYGGDVAAPVFSRVMAGALRTLGVAQDGPQQLRPTSSDPVKEEM
ncbi:transpeptidase involved in septal peptidoglycan synthesis (penicillin-binding protein 3) [Georgfuchsia toluolica]|uniref:Peptidoglycan D,D-transpeptidase FtsI n=1 Tax=Georgfuchsia toluolica TaxID=424218 RepID=A0A916N0N4_9PROT|nr:penicillin-binding protein 2 [Georgfuchsia toluolica]CAG4884108.1 transpeptidase involved in septal peptidoglycan synthesis (penicillin-binding protein 3) [Georgfuchsia toluolica]